jgi:flavin reductase (DIM6/NTAB) family NADH-FMN oxidoreductase RutF
MDGGGNFRANFGVEREGVSLLAADQITEGQYFSYPGRKFRYMAPEYLQDVDGHPVVPNSIAWFSCAVFQTMPMLDHMLVFARIDAHGEGRLKEPPLLYSSRHGWRITGDKAREPGVSIRDQLLARLGAAAGDDDDGDD